jgi:hypothetical protein
MFINSFIDSFQSLLPNFFIYSSVPSESPDSFVSKSIYLFNFSNKLIPEDEKSDC